MIGMKKNIFKLLLVLLLFPVFINASKYEVSQKLVKEYCQKIDADGRYFLCNGSSNYLYENKRLYSYGGFENGGLLSVGEFNVTKSNRTPSYLAPGIDYWTIKGDKIVANDLVTADKNSGNFGTRPTEYVKHNIKATGTGSRENAWEFEEVYKVTAKIEGDSGYFADNNNKADIVKLLNYDGSVSFKYTISKGYALSNLKCKGSNNVTHDTANTTFTVKNVRNDVDCRITTTRTENVNVLIRYYKEIIDGNGNLTYTLVKEVAKPKKYAEGDKVKIESNEYLTDQEKGNEYFLNTSKGVKQGVVPLDNSLVLSLYYDLKTIIDAKVSTNASDGAESGKYVTFEITVTNKINKSTKIKITDHKLKTAANAGKLINGDANFTKVINGYEFTLSPKGQSGSTTTIQYKFMVNEVPGKKIESQITYQLDGRPEITLEVINVGIEKTIKLVEVDARNVGANVAIVLDVSGSMSGTRITNARNAIVGFINQAFPQGSQINNSIIRVIKFANSASDVGVLATNYDTAQSLKTSVKAVGASGGTYYAKGLDRAYSTLFGSGGLKSSYPNNENIVIFLSDGEPFDESAAVTSSNKIKNAGGKVYTIGYGSISVGSSTYNVLKNVSGSASTTYIGTTDNIYKIFDDLFAEVSKTVEKKTTGGYVAINPKAIVNATHPIEFTSGGVVQGKVTSLDTAVSQGYAKKENGVYWVDATRYTALDEVRVTYYVPENK